MRLAQEYLTLAAGPAALAALRDGPLTPARVGAIAGAAGGPKFLVLSKLDQYLFGEWLGRSTQPIDLVGSSIGAWRLAAACDLEDPVAALQALEAAYIAQSYSSKPDRVEITAMLWATLERFFGPGVVAGTVAHPRYRFHAMTVRSRWATASDRKPLLAAGSGLAILSNMVSRASLGRFFERVVFSAAGARLRWADDGIATRHVALSAANTRDAVFASGNVPLMMTGVVDPAGAPPGIYRDGGVTDYHIDHPLLEHGNAGACGDPRDQPIVLMPHYVDRLIPGWLDKRLVWRNTPRHAAHTLLIGPGPRLLDKLVDRQVPERKDFYRYAADDRQRQAAWRQAADAGAWMRDAFAALVENQTLAQHIRPL